MKLVRPALALCLLFIACADDSGGATPAGSTGNGTTNDTGTPGSTTADPPASTGGAVDSTTGGSMTTTGANETTADPPATGSDTAGGTEGDACDACLFDSCGDVLETCVGTPSCVCWFDCLDGDGNSESCEQKCGELPRAFVDLGVCAQDMCAEPCGIEFVGGLYDPCSSDDACRRGTTCIEDLGYCSIDCTAAGGKCPAPAEGTAEPTCAPGVEDACLLGCPDDLMCPPGMTCGPFGGGQPVCMFE